MEDPKISRVLAVRSVTNTTAKNMIHRFLVSEQRMHPVADERFTRLEQVYLSFDASLPSIFQNPGRDESNDEAVTKSETSCVSPGTVKLEEAVAQVKIENDATPRSREEKKQAKKEKKEAKAMKKAEKKEKKERKRKRSLVLDSERAKKARQD
jgi:hypothetical protein